MTNVGDRLRAEREARDMTIEQVAEATGVGGVYLQAMESGAIDALPGRAFGKLYIRAYAEVLDFDPQPLIEDYDRELRLARGDPATPSRPAPAGSRPVAEAIARWKASKAPVREEAAAEPLPEEPIAAPVEIEGPAAGEPVPVAPVARSRRGVTPFVAAAVVVVAVGLYILSRDATPPNSATSPPEMRPSVVQPPPAAPPAPIPNTTAKIAIAAPPIAPVAPRITSAPGALSVSASGLGRRIVNTRLEGDGSQFAAGEVAWFQTRVIGGKAGDAIRHVWIHDGRAQQSITLRLGGRDWRTHSKKTIYKPGPWTVEARDGDGRVLATASFTCVPAGR